MTYKEWNIRIFRGPVLGNLIPLELKRTYPRFRMENGLLCASFVGFRAKIEQNAVTISDPQYYLKITYPHGRLQTFDRLPLNDAPYHAPRSCDPAAVKRLGELCDQVLCLFDEKSPNLEGALASYNSLLDTLLEAEQIAALQRYAAGAEA